MGIVAADDRGIDSLSFLVSGIAAADKDKTYYQTNTDIFHRMIFAILF
jgi:hypothetical protein